VTHRLYTDLAEWWPLLSERESHAEEAEHILSLIDGVLGGTALRILELGSGGGMLASHIDSDREVVLTDISSKMVSLAAQHNPGRRVLEGDMRSMRLGETFDAVLLHDAVMYLTSKADLFAAVQTAAAHLRPGGVFLMMPDVLKETFEEQTLSGGTTGVPAAQLMEWHWDADPSDDTYQVEMCLLLRDKDHSVRVVHEQHTMGLFSTMTYIDALRGANLEVIRDLVWDDQLVAEAFCGRRSA